MKLYCELTTSPLGQQMQQEIPGCFGSRLSEQVQQRFLLDYSSSGSPQDTNLLAKSHV